MLRICQLGAFSKIYTRYSNELSPFSLAISIRLNITALDFAKRGVFVKGERGNKPYDLELMLRLYLVQNLYNLSDEATVDEAIDSRAFSDFRGVESSNRVPDGDTLLRF